MARLAVFASGSGTNFEALALALAGGRHELRLLVCDRKDAFVFERAKRLGVAGRYISWYRRPREEAEAEAAAALREDGVDLIALAGFMRLFTKGFVEARARRIVNVHPAVLPGYPGIDSIRRAFENGETSFGVTVHFVDAGMDTGEIIVQESFDRLPGEGLAEVERRVHALEHRLYPRAVIEILDGLG